MKKKWLIFLLIGIVIVVGTLVLNANMLFPWQLNAKRNRKAALEYIAEHFPTAEITDVDYKTMKFNPTAIGMDTFYLELDGICFSLITQSGKVICDTYYEAKAEKFIRENFINGFMNESGLSPKIKMSFVIPPDYYGLLQKYILDDLYSFTGSVHITITQDYIDGVSAPKDVGWFYDFYQYWMKNCDLENCTVSIHYRRNNDYATNEVDYVISFRKGVKEMTFPGEKDFYDHFTT